MRINTIDSNYVMIELEEAKEIIYNSKLPRKLIEEISKAAFIVSLSKDDDGNTPYYFGLKREIFEKNNAMNTCTVEINNIQNAFMYAVTTNNCDKETLEKLGQLVNFRCKFKIGSLREFYGKKVTEYILEHGGYDYNMDINQSNIEDSDFILCDDSDIIRINLKQRKIVPTLQNPDVK